MHKNNNSDMKKEQISDGKKPELQCEICEAYFSAKTSLNRHIASRYDKQILYSCETCNSKFAQKGNLKRHIVSVHEGEKFFKRGTV